MLNPARTCLALVALITANGLSGCFTPTVDPQLSQAVIDARARRDAPPAASCPTGPLASVSPVTIGFAFNESELTAAMSRSLNAPAQWLGCHPATAAIVRPEADGHGGAPEQDALARRRAEVVRAYLIAQGVAADRIRLLPRGAGEPLGDNLLIRAEGRRW